MPWHRARLGRDVPTIDDLVDAARNAIDTLRIAAGGETVEVPVRVGLTGMLLQPGASVDLGWGRLRPTNDLDERSLNGIIDGTHSYSYESGEKVVIRYSGDIVLETTYPYSIKITDAGDMSFAGLGSARQSLQQKVDCLRLGFMLGMETDEIRSGVQWAWTSVLDPLSIGHTMS